MPKGPPDAPATPELDSLPARSYEERAGQHTYEGPEHIIIGLASLRSSLPHATPGARPRRLGHPDRGACHLGLGIFFYSDSETTADFTAESTIRPNASTIAAFATDSFAS